MNKDRSPDSTGEPYKVNGLSVFFDNTGNCAKGRNSCKDTVIQNSHREPVAANYWTFERGILRFSALAKKAARYGQIQRSVHQNRGVLRNQRPINDRPAAVLNAGARNARSKTKSTLLRETLSRPNKRSRNRSVGQNCVVIHVLNVFAIIQHVQEFFEHGLIVG